MKEEFKNTFGYIIEDGYVRFTERNTFLFA